jgi:hypothetical protein
LNVLMHQILLREVVMDPLTEWLRATPTECSVSGWATGPRSGWLPAEGIDPARTARV